MRDDDVAMEGLLERRTSLALAPAPSGTCHSGEVCNQHSASTILAYLGIDYPSLSAALDARKVAQQRQDAVDRHPTGTHIFASTSWPAQLSCVWI